jgi:hypothetical protein
MDGLSFANNDGPLLDFFDLSSQLRDLFLRRSMVCLYVSLCGADSVYYLLFLDCERGGGAGEC